MNEMENGNGGIVAVCYEYIVGTRMVGWMENTNNGIKTVS
jgi:hypothetical protein